MTTMLIQILLHTPRWVFALFLALLVLGVQQLFARQVTLRRVAVMPVAMSGLAVYGVVSAFAAQPLLALLVWAKCAVVVTALVMRLPLPASVQYDPASRRFSLPGSAVPLALMMGVFFTKYAAGVSLAVSPELATHTGFALGLSALYGVFSGLFIGRAARLWKRAAAATQSRLSYAA
jgi:hypothetical protein